MEVRDARVSCARTGQAGRIGGTGGPFFFSPFCHLTGTSVSDVKRRSAFSRKLAVNGVIPSRTRFPPLRQTVPDHERTRRLIAFALDRSRFRCG